MASYTLGELAERYNATVKGDPTVVLTGVTTLEAGGAGKIAFLSNVKYRPLLKTTTAEAVIVGSEDLADGLNLLVAKDPYRTFALISQLFNPTSHPREGIDPRAYLGEEVVLGEGVTIMAGAYVEDGADIGARAVIYPGVYLGRDVSVGEDTVIYPNVTVREGCKIGARVILQANCVIGSDGFGFAPGADGHVKIPQVGIVRIEDDVEIGALTSIDRAAMGETVVGEGTKIDNLVQLAHNVKVGRHCFLVSQAGVAGSTEIGDFVIIAAQGGVGGHLKVGDGARIAARAGVAQSLEAGRQVAGFPAIEHREWLKSVMAFSRTPELRRSVKAMERRIKELEAALLTAEKRGAGND